MAEMFKIEISGDKEMAAKVEKLMKELPQKIAQSLYKRAEFIMTRSKNEFVPVDLGTLKGTGHVSAPMIKGDNISVELAYGGPAAPYALIQHETREFVHTVGQWKYLETPMKEAAATLASLIAKDLKL